MNSFPRLDITRPNLQILANAGSGKTHALVTRIIRLLALGVPPRRIIALTFTRKAAGEFLSKLLQRLASASEEKMSALELSQAIQIDRSQHDYLELLQRVIEQLDKLQLTTLDGFFNRVVSAFPQELGLISAPSLLDVHAAEVAGKTSLRHALHKLTSDEKNLLLQSLFERDEESSPRSASRELESFRKEIHDDYLENPNPESWGNPERIWGVKNTPWSALTPAEIQYFRGIIAMEKGEPPFAPKTLEAWHQLLRLTRGIKTNTLVQRILSSLDEWKSGTASLLFNRISYQVTLEAQQAASALVEHYVYECTEYRLREAQTIHHLLDLYEQEYGEKIRNQGQLTFSDVTNLLQPDTDFQGMGRASSKDSTLARLQLDERLDTLFDHWLLDEFQDTSRNQYRALENILDEVICEAARGGDRSFFCVGDIKQAIYGWRKGDSRLFDEIYSRYNQGSGGIVRDHLSASWRSSQEILDTLNAVFGNLDSTAPTLPEEVRMRWENAWTPHLCARNQERQTGFFSWESYHIEKDQEPWLDLQEKVVSLLQTLQPRMKEGMTIALLVRSGNEANEWLERLHTAGIEALSESNPPVGRDNPVAAAVHSAISLGVHPEDLFALNHLLMDPLKGQFFPKGNLDQEIGDFINRSAKLISEGGFTALMEWLLALLSPLIHDQFSKARAASLHRAARKADASGIKNCDDFLTMLLDYTEQGSSAPQAVQVMTIHKAKGLEYDMVVLPVPPRPSALDSLKNRTLDLWQNRGGEPFLMKLPAEEIRNVAGNETLVSAVTLKKQELAFESLCVWYVAMSRAKEALYLFTPPQKEIEKEKCPNFPQLLAAGLKDHPDFQHPPLDDSEATLGDPRWFEKFAARTPEYSPDPLPSSVTIRSRPAPLIKSRPSDGAHQILLGAQAFSERNALRLGEEVHAYFAKLFWMNEKPVPDFSDLSTEARELLKPCLENPEIRQLFQEPKGENLLWREQHFDLILDSQWVSGCFDRVVISLDSQGKATGADLLDFKTDQASREQFVATHRLQMELYRRALSRLVDLPEEKIRAVLVHVRSSGLVVTHP